MSNNIIRLSIVFFSVVFLLSCGGGGGGDSKSNSDLVAHAGFDQTIRSGSQVILSGKNSEKKNAIKTRVWTAISDLQGGKLVPQRNKGAAKFVAPKVTSAQTFEFGYTLTDVKGNVSKDSVNITVIPGGDTNKFLNQNFRNDERIRVVVGTEKEESLPAPTGFEVTLDLIASYGNKVHSVEDVRQSIKGDWYFNTGGQSEDSTRNPSIYFNLPQLYLSDLPEIIDQTVLPDEASARLELSAIGSNSIEPYLYVYAGERLLSSGKSPIALDYDEVRRTLGGDNRQRAEQYYDSIDPEKRKLTLCHWKQENGITPDIEAKASANGIVQVNDGRVIHQKYLNGYDLGFGRDMYVYQKDSGDVAAWVVNYPFMDALENQSDVIATVVMEYSPNSSGSESFTRFYTYVESVSDRLKEGYLLDGNQIPSNDPCFHTDGKPRTDKGINPADFRGKLSYGLDFDGRGYRYMPEACTVCHGGIGPEMDIPENGDIQASFLPWDVHNLFFHDDNFEVRPKEPADGELRLLLKETSEDTIRALNESVLITRGDSPTDPIRELIHGWYGGVISDNSLPEKSAFDEGFVPDGWKQNPEMYTKVIGPMCRTCHIARPEESGLALTEEGQLETYINSTSRALIEDQRVMPLARLTMDNLWGELDTNTGMTGLQVLSDYLGGNLKRHAKPFALITPNGGTSVKPNETLIFDAFNTYNYQSINWSVSPATGTTLTSESALQTGFSASAPGSYTLTLELKNGDQIATDSIALTVTGEPLNDDSSKKVQDGKAKFKSACASCHSTKDIGGSDTAPNLSCAGKKVVKNLGSIDAQMNKISLSDTDVTNLKAYLDSFTDCISNQKPQAKAGTYPTVKDDDGNGKEEIQLDGSGSSDAEDDKNQLSYHWTLNGKKIGDKQKFKYTFNVGTHEVKLKVTDTNGASDEDSAKIVVEKKSAPEKTPVEKGKDLFSSVGCTTCHKGSDLKEENGVSAKCGTSEDIKRMGTDYIGKTLSSDQVNNIKAYLNSFNCDSKPNTAPVAKIKGAPSITKQADSVNSKGEEYIRFTLDGRESTDKESPNNLKYEWSCGSSGVLGRESTYTRDFTVGKCDWKLKVIDPQGLSSTATVKVTVTEINKEPGFVVFEKGSYTFDETAGRVTIKLKRKEGSYGELRFHFKVDPRNNGDEEKYGKDFKRIDSNDNITFAHGVTEITQSFDIVDDEEEENTEEFRINLHTGYEVEGNRDYVAHTDITIRDDDSRPSARFSERVYFVDEGAGRIKLDIERTGSLVGDLKMHARMFGISGDQPIFGEDYNTIDGDDNIIIRNGKSSASISFDIIDDALIEGTESFAVDLLLGFENEGPGDYIDGVEVRILDNEEEPEPEGPSPISLSVESQLHDKAILKWNGESGVTYTVFRGSNQVGGALSGTSKEVSVGENNLYKNIRYKVRGQKNEKEVFSNEVTVVFSRGNGGNGKTLSPDTCSGACHSLSNFNGRSKKSIYDTMTGNQTMMNKFPNFTDRMDVAEYFRNRDN